MTEGQEPAGVSVRAAVREFQRFKEPQAVRVIGGRANRAALGTDDLVAVDNPAGLAGDFGEVAQRQAGFHRESAAVAVSGPNHGVSVGAG